jgi:hypothetical protein
MSGLPINSGEGRRSFLKKSFWMLGGASLLGWSCSGWKRTVPIRGSILGAAAATGHLLREGKFPEPSVILPKKYVIVGGGIAGLSAARWLKKKGVDDFVLLELDKTAGGNAVSGKNDVSAYPWGAHYLPIPDTSMTELHDFLEENGVITARNGTLPVYNDYYLCFDPQERLYINGYWQDGLVPDHQVPDKDAGEIRTFFKLMDGFREAKGKDGKYAFAIPVDESSADEAFTAYDRMTMGDYLRSQNLHSAYLHWFVNYSCSDDYGTSVEMASAWAGIHYFCSRRGKASNAENNAVLTWPEGNAWLMNRLKDPAQEHINTQSLVYAVTMKDKEVWVDYYDVTTHTTTRLIADKVIMACPQFVGKRLLHSPGGRSEELYSKFTYAPWMVANITVKEVPREPGIPLSWDNVFYGQASLGYVNANQQDTQVIGGRKVLTYYLPLTGSDPAQERGAAFRKTHAEWCEQIITELSAVHTDIRAQIEYIDIWLWGHGMIRPLPGVIWGKERQEAMKPIAGKIFFAHSDLSGISIFENAFYQGIRAAGELISANRSAHGA